MRVLFRLKINNPTAANSATLNSILKSLSGDGWSLEKADWVDHVGSVHVMELQLRSEGDLERVGLLFQALLKLNKNGWILDGNVGPSGPWQAPPVKM